MNQNTKPAANGLNYLLKLYSLGFGLAWPFLRKNRRLQTGWEQRTGHALPLACDLWLQAASGGEAYLALELLRGLKSHALKVLVTTNTAQGLEILQKGFAGLQAGKIEARAWFCPLDKPEIAARFVAAAQPRLLVLLETELWPGMLGAVKKQNIPVLLVNGRISAKSLRGYLKVKGLFRALAPKEVMAVSAADAARFKLLFNQSAVSVMPNLKFDRVLTSTTGEPTPLARYLPQDAPFVVLGSVRQEEEAAALAIIRALWATHPKAVIGLYPRHMERAPFWVETLTRLNLPFVRRSQLQSPLGPGAILLGDVFGELEQAYQCAAAVFVGGSLAPLGGQNFMEPLAAGVIPVIGPHWQNFAWVGSGIIDAGLLNVASDVNGVIAKLKAGLAAPTNKACVRARFKAYIARNLGGGQMACAKILTYLPKN